MSDLRSQLKASLKEAGSSRDMLRAQLLGRVSGICKGYSMPDDANQAMRDICDALIEFHGECAKSFDAEDGPFAGTFKIYAEEQRSNAAEMTRARKRWSGLSVVA